MALDNNILAQLNTYLAMMEGNVVFKFSENQDASSLG